MNKMPQALYHAKKLIKDHPELFKDCSLTPFVIGQAMMNFFNDLNSFIEASQTVSVFDNPLQNGLSKVNIQLSKS